MSFKKNPGRFMPLADQWPDQAPNAEFRPGWSVFDMSQDCRVEVSVGERQFSACAVDVADEDIPRTPDLILI